MRINLVSELDENSQLRKISGPSQIYAWFTKSPRVDNRRFGLYHKDPTRGDIL